jgi:endogenous inhibitor of DNA gyrase (YacG/DUF329 family)
MIRWTPQPNRAMTTYPCAICKRKVPYAGQLPDAYPFCSQRCRLVDLAKWFREEYGIDRDLTPEDLDDPDISSKLEGRE